MIRGRNVIQHVVKRRGKRCHIHPSAAFTDCVLHQLFACLPKSLRDEIFLTLSVLKKKKKNLLAKPSFAQKLLICGHLYVHISQEACQWASTAKKTKKPQPNPASNRKCFPGPLIVDLCGLHVSPVQTLNYINSPFFFSLPLRDTSSPHKWVTTANRGSRSPSSTILM